MSNQGWIKLHRGLLDWEWYDDVNTKIVFLHLILKANHKEVKYRGETINVGSLLTGRELLSKETGLSVQQIRRAISNLETTREITTKKSRKGTVIQIVKYKDYQVATSKTTAKQPQNNQKATTNKNDNNEKNEKKLSDFEFFWENYPTKIGKAKCLKKFLDLKQEDVDKIKSTIKDFAAYKQFKGWNHPNPETYLNQERWNDEIKTQEHKQKDLPIDPIVALAQKAMKENGLI